MASASLAEPQSRTNSRLVLAVQAIIWRAPLVPLALAATAGVVLDRTWGVPLVVSLAAAGASVLAWACSRLDRRGALPVVYLWLGASGLGAAYHHYYRDGYAADDIGGLVPADPGPVRLRGVLAEEPSFTPRPRDDPLQSLPRDDTTQAVLRATFLRRDGDWLPVSGLARLIVSGHLASVHVGDEVEVVGRWQAPGGPANPGEFDYAGYLRDQRIRTLVLVRRTPDGVTRLAEHRPSNPSGWLAFARGWGQRELGRLLPAAQAGVGTALLLGDSPDMTAADWDRYVRTGVIHVLAISGQHLVVLAAFLWSVLRVAGLRRRRGAAFVALFLLAYALVAGGRPPVLRSAVMVCAASGGLLLRRPALTANSFALAWIVVGVLSPTDLFSAGCQLSFLAVAILYWGVRFVKRMPDDPVERLIEISRPVWQRSLRGVGRWVFETYAITLVMWLAAAPLVAARYHLVSPVALLLSPPLVVFTSIALLTGFLLLLAGPFCAPLAGLLGQVTGGCLAACEWLVDAGDRLPGGHWYVGDVPSWWLAVFYLAVFALLTLGPLRSRWRWALPAGAAWLGVGLLAGSSGPARQELRVTFLAVGHGGCTVLELPDGRAVLYDAGSLAGPDVARRQVAPFLWSRGIRRLDEVILSHADLDHFNGLPPLLDLFAVGQVTLTPSFANKETPGVRLVLNVLARRGVATRVVQAGDRLQTDDVEMLVLHPPPVGPDGNENARSLVLLVRHAGHSLLLTGDLEGTGLDRVLALPRPAGLDVLMGPHHGSRTANTPELAAWASPRLAIGCTGPPRWPVAAENPYQLRGAETLGTWPDGAITVRSRSGELIVETYVTGKRRQW